jgi:hypothetical protein
MGLSKKQKKLLALYLLKKRSQVLLFGIDLYALSKYALSFFYALSKYNNHFRQK